MRRQVLALFSAYHGSQATSASAIGHSDATTLSGEGSLVGRGFSSAETLLRQPLRLPASLPASRPASLPASRPVSLPASRPASRPASLQSKHKEAGLHHPASIGLDWRFIATGRSPGLSGLPCTRLPEASTARPSAQRGAQQPWCRSLCKHGRWLSSCHTCDSTPLLNGLVPRPQAAIYIHKQVAVKNPVRKGTTAEIHEIKE
jgi:hypothetical protein